MSPSRHLMGAGADAHGSRRVDWPLGASAIPLASNRQECHVAAERLNLLKIGVLQRAIPAQHIGGLPNHQPEVGQFEGNVLETQERPSFCLMLRQHLGVHLEPRERDAALDSPVQLEQLEMHVYGAAELGLPILDAAQLGGLTRVGPA